MMMWLQSPLFLQDFPTCSSSCAAALLLYICDWWRFGEGDLPSGCIWTHLRWLVLEVTAVVVVVDVQRRTRGPLSFHPSLLLCWFPHSIQSQFYTALLPPASCHPPS